MKVDHVVNLGGNLWSEEHLNLLTKLNKYHRKKEKKHSVLESVLPHKGTKEAVEFCEKNEKEFELLKSAPFEELMEKIAKNEHLVFLPHTLETCSRIVLDPT